MKCSEGDFIEVCNLYSFESFTYAPVYTKVLSFDRTSVHIETLDRTIVHTAFIQTCVYFDRAFVI